MPACYFLCDLLSHRAKPARLALASSANQTSAMVDLV